MFGRFLELALAAEDILASLEFYERLGFQQCPTGDAWPHRYAVLGDGRVHLGLHARMLDSPAVSFVLPGLKRARARLQLAGLTPELAQLDEESLHCLQLRDPGEHLVMLLEARTFSPSAGSSGGGRCGDFLHLSLPQPDVARAREFWEAGGLVALPEEASPYQHVPLTGDQLDLAFHSPQFCRAPLLVFEHPDPHSLVDRTEERTPHRALRRPPGLDGDYALLQAPEGTQLLIVASMN